MTTTRRQLFTTCAGIAAASWISPNLMGAADPLPSVRFPVDPRSRVSVAAYPFREFIVGWKGWDGKTPSSVTPERQIQLKDFAAHVREKFNIRNVELWSRVFPSIEATYVEQLAAAVQKAGSAVVDIAADTGQSQYSRDPAQRKEALSASKRWIDVGAALGSPSVRTHIEGSKQSKPDVALAAETLKRVADYAATKNVVVHLENDNPISEDPFFIVQVIEKVNSPWLRALPDFGNSLAAHDEDFAYRAIDAMFAHAYGICHVKDGEVNDDGKPVHVDLARTFAILKRHNYKGYCSIEYDAPGDPYRPTSELIEQTVHFLS